MIYVIAISREHQITKWGFIFKVGYTAGSVKSRVRNLQTGNANKLDLWLKIYGNKRTEELIHEYLSDYRINGEWFRLNEEGYRQFFILSAFMQGVYAQFRDEDSIINGINKSIEFLLNMRRYNKLYYDWFAKDGFACFLRPIEFKNDVRLIGPVDYDSHLENRAGDGI